MEGFPHDVLNYIVQYLSVQDAHNFAQTCHALTSVCETHNWIQRLLNTGQAHAFGYGESGRLGDGDTSDHSVGVPQLICSNKQIRQISCGNAHTAFISYAPFIRE